MSYHPRRVLDSFEPRRLLPLLSGSCKGKYSKAKPAALLRHLLLVAVFSVVAVTLLYVPRRLVPPSPSAADEEEWHEIAPPPCSSVANNSICCDRTAFRTDVCFMRGDVRTHSRTSSILLLLPSAEAETREERIRPYTRKWENGTMSTIHELRLRTATTAAADDGGSSTAPCDVRHDVPAVVFSSGGYTGNVYHEFNDGLIPLYITSHRYNKRVVFVVVEYHDWWASKYRDVLSRLSDYPLIDFSEDNRTHCFPEAVVGLKIHDELAVDPALMSGNRTIRDFRQVLDDAYKPRIESMLGGGGGGEGEEAPESTNDQVMTLRKRPRPKLVLMSRRGSRRIENEEELVELIGNMGFSVEVMRPEMAAEMASIYRSLNACDVMVGVHGAAMTHLLFLRPGAMLIQIVPLGTKWASDSYYGEPARKMGLDYEPYEVLPRESSLYREYRKDDPVLADPESVNEQGWEMTKKVYLSGQNVKLDLTRFRETLVGAYKHVARDMKRRRRALKERGGIDIMHGGKVWG